MSNFLRSLTRNITSRNTENFVFHSLLGWNMMIPAILITPLIHFFLKVWENVRLGVKALVARKQCSHHQHYHWWRHTCWATAGRSSARTAGSRACARWSTGTECWCCRCGRWNSCSIINASVYQTRAEPLQSRFQYNLTCGQSSMQHSSW